MPSATYTVEGMTCGHCVSSVKREVSRIDGVSDVEVNLGTGALTVESEGALDPESVRAAVEEAGYELAGPSVNLLGGGGGCCGGGCACGH